MPPPMQAPSGAIVSPGPVAPLVPRVILLIAQEARREQMRELVGRLAPTSRIEVARDVLDAMRRMVHAAADLLILDYAIDGAAGPALMRNLARATPSLLVLAFDDDVPQLANPIPDLWPWSDAEVAVQRALERRSSVACRATDRQRR